MQLLNVRTYRLERFYNERSTPPYAILSHTWTDGKEVQYADLLRYSPEGADDKLDWKKIHYTCRQAIADGLSYAWIDTCCIDKSSSAELSEAINSMFRWYQNAKICYVYMADVGTMEEMSKGESGGTQWPSTVPNLCWDADGKTMHDSIPVASRGLLQTLQIRQSRWFTRGWTLQELIAPPLLVFYDCNWRFMGSRRSLLPDIRATTGIPNRVLIGSDRLHNYGIAVRMSWASRRTTTRVEDEAYCLLGIFDINMPLLYGEGPKAFLRLQEEILKVSTDHTIFAWNGNERQLLAPSTAHFANSSTIVPRNRPAPGDVHEMTNRGCRISLLFLPQLEPIATSGTVVLDCIDTRVPYSDIVLPLQIADRNASDILEVEPDTHMLRYYAHRDRYSRHGTRKLVPLKRHQLLILRYPQDRPSVKSTTLKFALATDEETLSFHLYPDTAWDPQTNCCTVESGISRRKIPQAVWIGSKPVDQPQGSKQRLRKSSKDPNGIVIAWRWDLADYPCRLRIVRRRCKYTDALKTATYLLDRVKSSTPLNSHFSRHWIDDRLPPDQILTYLWHGIRITFQAQPIGVNRDGIMILAQREPGTSQRIKMKTEQAFQWLHDHSTVFRIFFWGLAGLLCLCALAELPKYYRQKLKSKIVWIRSQTSTAWIKLSRKRKGRRKNEEAATGVEEVADVSQPEVS